MKEKLIVYISRDAAIALSDLALRERREIREQAGWLLEQILLRPGVLSLLASQEREYAQQQ